MGSKILLNLVDERSKWRELFLFLCVRAGDNDSELRVGLSLTLPRGACDCRRNVCVEIFGFFFIFAYVYVLFWFEGLYLTHLL